MIGRIERRMSGPNAVIVELDVRGSTMKECPSCQGETVHALLEEGYVMCTLCNKVYPR